MKKLLKNTKLLWLACFAFAGAAASLQTASVLLLYEPDTNYFSNQLPLPLFAVLFAILGAICGSFAAFGTDTKKLADSPFAQQPIPTPAAFGFLALAVLFAFGKDIVSSRLTVATIIFAIIALVYSALFAVKPLRQYKTLFTFLGFGTLIALVLVTAYYYFDVSVEMNAPLKTATQTGLLFGLVYYTGELRYLLGEERPRAYLFLSAWTVAIGSLSAFAVPVAYFAGKLNRVDYAAGGLLVFCIVLTVLTRLNTLLHPQACDSYKDDEQPKTAQDTDTDGNGENEI